ncbi:hypothetical protein GA0115240_145811 [Streptomyces sp. DvalAA-14]|uniref:hypothetical protein n=1 Tax=unclassified Streptomyces TaxID=2593676 RepID=UPI00081BB4CB|nr:MULTISPECIES: hypothetical protein [unclassified Streptomyces]MYS22889.1 hypothetical protein [Streptomyces sp. SID4948]SCE24085.1 hypothetical protein GA0115240_145811 [Streptomyces sp. DvalAA-14]
MDWLAPVNTLIGAGIGIGSTLLADRLRWRRDRAALNEDTRRQTYAAFMGALSDVYQRLDEIARAGHAAGEAQLAAREVFVSRNLYPLRYEIALIAPWEVMDAVNQAFWRVRDLRDLVASGTGRGNPDFGRQLHAYLAAAEQAQVVMRRDLGTSWPEPAERSTGGRE